MRAIVPVPFLVLFYQTPIMPTRKFDNGPAGVSKVHGSLKPVPAQKDPGSFEAVRDNPSTPAKGGPQKAVAPKIPARAATVSPNHFQTLVPCLTHPPGTS